MSDRRSEPSIPLLDLERFNGSAHARTAFLGDLRDAARQVGFFYVTGHGIEATLLDGVMSGAARFFALPERDKLAVDMVNSPHFRGYTRLAAEHTRGLEDWREQIDIGAEKPVLSQAGAPVWVKLQGPNQWPAALPELRPTVLRWQAEATRVLTHRVITPPAGRERMSAAFFLGARLDATVPLLSLPPELAAQARGPERDPTNPLFRDVGQNYLKGRLRSHPDVARRYYADLIASDARAAPTSGY